MADLGFNTIGKCELPVLRSFECLPDDDFLKEAYIFRKRKYSSAMLHDKKVQWVNTDEVFYQSEKINQYCGGMQRRFQSLEKNIKDYIADTLVPEALPHLPGNSYSLGAHQIRVITTNDKLGKPAPEGIHQDGFDFVMTVCVNVSNVVGGNSILVDSHNHQKVIYERVLEPCEFIIFDDRIHAHYVSPIAPKLPGDGFRDVFVLTFKANHD